MTGFSAAPPEQGSRPSMRCSLCGQRIWPHQPWVVRIAGRGPAEAAHDACPPPTLPDDLHEDALTFPGQQERGAILSTVRTSGADVHRRDVITIGGIPHTVETIQEVARGRKLITFTDRNTYVLHRTTVIEVTRPTVVLGPATPPRPE